MVDEEPVFVVLVGFGDVGSQELEVASLAAELRAGRHTDDVPSDRDDDVAELGVAPYADPLVRQVARRAFGLLDRDDRHFGAVSHVDLDRFGQIADSAVLEDDGSP